ncbi:MAG: hypothetical protein ACLP00_08720 [Terracidiphilus sp.]
MSTLTTVLLAVMMIGVLAILLRVAVIMERVERPHGASHNARHHAISGAAASHIPKLR